MDSQTYRLGFIGAGKLAGSVIRGLLLTKFCSPGEIIASEPNDEVRGVLDRELQIVTTTNNAAVVSSAETIFVGVKPQYVLPIVRENAAAFRDKLVVSFAAGVRLASMEEAADARFARVMTNTPSAIARAATGVASGQRSTHGDVARLLDIFNNIGVAVEITEDQIDAVTALAGSGPAFVYSVIEGLAAGGENVGLAGDAALRLAAQTALGAAELILLTGKSPEQLRNMVVTPGGTTAAGLQVMKEHATAAGLAAAVEAATKRGSEMAAQFAS
jgi:pyrroline-5-carboxylate reductase